MNTIVLSRPLRRRPDVFGAPGVFNPGGILAPLSWAANMPSMSLDRDGEDGILTLELPGLNPAEDISIEISESRLEISGVRRENSGRMRRESRFSRAMTLPEHITGESVSASYEAGVLRVRITDLFPAPSEPEKIKIAIKEGDSQKVAVGSGGDLSATEGDGAEGSDTEGSGAEDGGTDADAGTSKGALEEHTRSDGSTELKEHDQDSEPARPGPEAKA